MCSGMVLVMPRILPGDHRNGAEFAHRAGVAEDDAVEQAPLDIGQRDAAEDLPAAGPQHAGGLFLFGPLGLHERNQFAGDERQA